LPRMRAMGIGGKAQEWSPCYLTEAKQRVV
jgi:hypothetical protein